MNVQYTVDLLKEIYQGSKTAMDAISILIPKARNNDLKRVLEYQLDEYHSIADEATMQLQGFRELPNDTDVFTKLGMWTAVKMNTITNSNSDHIAEIMINGSTTGIVDMTKYIHSHPGCDVYAVELANRLIAAEDKNIQYMREYL
ncbi:MAG: hypothetical protein J1F64_04235 [Oscillospiraceae bacterium]|nr:hypothetical protein [Oscillospiraceae bacterium]